MKEKFSMKGFLREHRHDLVLLLSLIFIAAAALLTVHLTRAEGAYVRVEVEGETVAEYPLSENGEYKLTDGNTLVIEDGCAYMKDADCPDRTCVRTGKISERGQTIVCLPNKVSVTVVGNDGGVDLES